MNLIAVRARAVSLIPVFCSVVLGGVGLIVREDGVGAAKVGMTLPQLNAVMQERFTMPHAKEDQGCFYVKSKKLPHVSFMIEDARMVRVDVDAPGLATAKGIQVGDLEAQALRVYGSELKVEPHHYTDGHYLTFKSADGKYGIRFETEKGKIKTYYAGKYEAIQYVEGCE